MIRAAAFALGLSVAFAAVVAWRVPPGEGVLGTDVVVASGPTGELQVDPVGPFLSAAGLQPGTQGAVEPLKVRNITAIPQVVRVRALPTGHDLDEILWVAVEAGDLELHRGPLGELRDGSTRGVTIAPGETRIVSVRVWLPPESDEGFRGRIESIQLELVPEGVPA